MRPTLLFDIDGTIAKIDHRRPLVTKNKPDWKTFNSLMGDDQPNLPVVTLYKTLWSSNEYEIFLLSGRSEEFREITETWLFWNQIPFKRLIMRRKGDGRADEKIKEEIYLDLIHKNHEILFVVDDRDKVVDMWRRNGVTCLQCDYGNF